jgi:hypothetical protein
MKFSFAREPNWISNKRSNFSIRSWGPSHKKISKRTGKRIIPIWLAVISKPAFKEEMMPGGGEISSEWSKFITH